MSKKKIWQKDDEMEVEQRKEEYLISKGVPDDKLLPYDVKGSKAHANMLEKIGILTKTENEQLQEGLDEILKKHEQEDFDIFDYSSEGVHTAIENYLTEKCGEAGKKLHTGRSRNDQVLVAMRLFLTEKITEIQHKSLDIAKNFLDKAKEYKMTPFPGYTHSQQAMLSSLGLYFGSYVEELLDDIKICQNANEIIGKNPLGSAAGYGVAFDLDREYTTQQLNLSGVQINSMYCQTSRGKFGSLTVETLAQVMHTLERFAHDMVIFTMQETDFFDVDKEMTTGSSIMPHKQNLDYMEVLRGQLSMLNGSHNRIKSITQKQISGYNRDTKFIKKELFYSFELVLESLYIIKEMTKSIEPKEEQIKQKIVKEMFAADIANDMVKEENIPFREAYQQAMDEVQEKEIDYQKNLESKISLGSSGNLGLDQYEKQINKLEEKLNN